jgi:hypothetical protein
MVLNIIKEYRSGDTFSEIGERYNLTKWQVLNEVRDCIGKLATQRLRKEHNINRKRRSQNDAPGPTGSNRSVGR